MIELECRYMTGLDELPTTDSGHVPKRDAMRWLETLEKASDEDLKQTVVEKPAGFTGSTYPTEISNVRLTGGPEFIEAAGSLMKPLLEFENATTRVELNVQQTQDRETEELTDNYALYISVAERS